MLMENVYFSDKSGCLKPSSNDPTVIPLMVQILVNMCWVHPFRSQVIFRIFVLSISASPHVHQVPLFFKFFLENIQFCSLHRRETHTLEQREFDFLPRKIDVSPRNRANCSAFLGKEKFFRSFKPIEGAVEALKEMQAHPALEVGSPGPWRLVKMFKEKPDRNAGGEMCFFSQTDRNS